MPKPADSQPWIGQIDGVASRSASRVDGRMAAAGVPPFLVPLMVSFDVNAKAGNVSGVSDAVKRLTGTPAQPLKDWLVANKAAFAA